MAEQIKQFEPQKGRPQIYPWDEWTDGKTRRLYYGKDFHAQLKSFRTMIHRKARDLGMGAHTKINAADRSIDVFFYSNEK